MLLKCGKLGSRLQEVHRNQTTRCKQVLVVTEPLNIAVNILKQRNLFVVTQLVRSGTRVNFMFSIQGSVYNASPWISIKLLIFSTDPEERRHHDCCSRSQYGQLASSVRSSVHITGVHKRRLQSSHDA